MIFNPLYHQLDDNLKKIKELETEQDFMNIKRFSIEKYLLMMLSHEYKNYTDAIKKSMKKNNIKYQLKMKSVILDNKQLIHQFLKTFTKEMDNYFLYTAWGWYQIKDMYFKDSFLYFVSQEQFPDKVYPKIKLKEIEIFPRTGFIFIHTEETESGKDKTNIETGFDQSNKDTAIYIEDSKMIYQSLKNKLFGIILPEYNLFEPFLKNINNPDEGISQIKEWIIDKDFLPERLWGACGGHGQGELIDKHPAVIMENIQKKKDWGTSQYCSFKKCHKNKKICCFVCDEFDTCEDTCKKTEEPYIFESQETLKGTLLRAKSFLQDEFLKKNLTTAEQHVLSENIKYVQNSNILDKIEETKRQERKKEESETIEEENQKE